MRLPLRPASMPPATDEIGTAKVFAIATAVATIADDHLPRPRSIGNISELLRGRDNRRPLARELYKQNPGCRQLCDRDICTGEDFNTLFHQSPRYFSSAQMVYRITLHALSSELQLAAQ